MPIEMHTSLGEVAARTELTISDHLGLSPSAPITGDTVEVMLPAGRLVIAATDEIGVSTEARRSRRRAVATCGTPICWLTVSSPWDLPWSHEPAVHCTFLDLISGMAIEITDGRFAFEGGTVAIADAGADRWLSITSEGWVLTHPPASRTYLQAARGAAIGAWRKFVAQPARLV